jgi:hypothetical protein
VFDFSKDSVFQECNVKLQYSINHKKKKTWNLQQKRRIDKLQELKWVPKNQQKLYNINKSSELAVEVHFILADWIAADSVFFTEGHYIW